MNKQSETPQVREVMRLDPDTYRKLEKEANAHTLVGSTTTDLQAAYLLGMQHVLGILRNGFVVGR